MKTVLIGLRKFDEPKENKLTPYVYRRRATELGPRWQDLEKCLASSEQGLEDVAQAVRIVMREIRGRSYPEPTSELRRIRHLFGSKATDALAARQFTLLDAFALAAVWAAQKHPDDFGVAEDLQEVAKRRSELLARRDELNAQLATAWTPNDILIEDLDAQGRARVRFKLAPVPIYPLGDCGERLAHYLLRQEQRA